MNGQLVGQTMTGGVMPTSTGPLDIGGNGYFGEYFSGLIDDVRIYNRALSATEIQADSQAPLTN